MESYSRGAGLGFKNVLQDLTLSRGSDPWSQLQLVKGKAGKPQVKKKEDTVKSAFPTIAVPFSTAPDGIHERRLTLS
jgi:hypothetical protein